MDVLSCAKATSAYPTALFVLGTGVMVMMIKISEGLTLRQTLAVIIGISRRIRWNGKIDSVHAATILLPLGLWVYLIQECAALPA